MITPKSEFINLALKLICNNCSRRKRIVQRLYEELSEDEFDFEKDRKMAKIVQEEA